MSNVETFRTQNEELVSKRVMCISMNDEYPVAEGEMGTINNVDDMGTIHVQWDSGRRIGLIQGEDKYEILD